MSQFLGADVEQLAALSREFVVAARKFDQLRDDVTAAVGTASWTGADGDRIRSEWCGSGSHMMTDASQLLRTAAQSIDAHGAEQLEASGASGSAAVGALAQRPVQNTGPEGGTPERHASPALQSVRIADYALKVEDARQVAAPLLHRTVKEIPYIGDVLTIAGLTLTAHDFGTDSDEFREEAVNATGGTIASIAGPAGSLAWFTGWTIGKTITDNTQADENAADVALGYAHRNMPPEPPTLDYAHATPAQIQADAAIYSTRAAEARRVCEQAKNPVFAAASYIGGIGTSSLPDPVKFVLGGAAAPVIGWLTR